MLKDRNAIAIVATRDIAKARIFYGEVLGLEIAFDMGEVLTFKTGDTFLNVYTSDKAGTNEANAVCWDCGDELEAIVDQLQAKGVAFEHYPDMEGMTLKGDIHIAGDFKAAWFKDPDGNILHINSM